MANSGIVPSLVGKDDLIRADELCHACLFAGSQLAGAKLLTFRHNDMAHCEELLKAHRAAHPHRSEEHTSELQSLMRISYAVFCLKKKKTPDTSVRQIAAHYPNKTHNTMQRHSTARHYHMVNRIN